MKTALFAIAAMAGLALLTDTTQAADRTSPANDFNSRQSARSSDSHSTPVQLAGYGHGRSHSYHRGGHHRGGHHQSHYRSHHRGHGHYNSYHRGHGHHRYYGNRYHGGYRYGGSGIGFSGRNFSFYYGF